MGRQGFGAVFSAEFKRVMLRPKALVTIAVFVIASVAAFAGSIALIDWAAAEAARQGIETPSEAGAFPGFGVAVSILSFGFGCWASAFVSRDYNDGSVMSFLTVVPNRATLFLARLLPWIAASLLAALVAMAACLAIGLPKVGGGIPAIAIQGALSALSVACACILGFCCGTITKKGALSIISFLALFFILPTALGLFLGGPEVLVKIVHYIQMALPGNAFEALPELAAMPSDPEAGFDVVVRCLATLAWTVGLPAAAFVLFKKRATLGR